MSNDDSSETGTCVNEQPKSAGIIGGNGHYGRWLAELFKRHGYSVHSSDIGTHLSNQQVAERSDVVIVSVPIGKVVGVIDEIAPFLGPHQLLVDVTSVKSHVLPAMERTTAELLSLHPMFAPTSNVAGQTCIGIRVRPGRYTAAIESLIRAERMNLIHMASEEHDQTMAFVQGLTHFQAISAASCLAVLDCRIDETFDTGSPVYRMRLAMIGRILAQQPRLYAEIQIYNPYVPMVLDALEISAKRYRELIAARDVDGFIAELEQAKSALGDFVTKAAEVSDRLVAALRADK